MMSYGPWAAPRPSRGQAAQGFKFLLLFRNRRRLWPCLAFFLSNGRHFWETEGRKVAQASASPTPCHGALDLLASTSLLHFSCSFPSSSACRESGFFSGSLIFKFPNDFLLHVWACVCTCMCRVSPWSPLFHLNWLASRPLLCPSPQEMGVGTSLCFAFPMGADRGRESRLRSSSILLSESSP